MSFQSDPNFFDATLAVKVVVTEPDSAKADALFDAWANEGKQLIAPAFFVVETEAFCGKKWHCSKN